MCYAAKAKSKWHERFRHLTNMCITQYVIHLHILTYSLSTVDTIILHNGVARLWSLSAVQPVDGSSKRFAVLEIVRVVNRQ